MRNNSSSLAASGIARICASPLRTTTLGPSTTGVRALTGPIAGDVHVLDDVSKARRKSSFPFSHPPNLVFLHPHLSQLYPFGIQDHCEASSYLRWLFCAVSAHILPQILVRLTWPSVISHTNLPGEKSRLTWASGQRTPCVVHPTKKRHLAKRDFCRLVHVFVLRASFRTPPAAQAANVSRAETL